MFEPSTARMGSIGLALSGGSSGAAAFRLRAMEALHCLGLIHDVRHLSAASGGCLIGARSLAGITKGEQFPYFCAEKRAVLKRNLMTETLDEAQRSRGSLVQCTMETYAAILRNSCDKPIRLGKLETIQNARDRVESSTLNATPFSIGYNFRFEARPESRAPLGNRAASMSPPNSWIDIRLCDAVAASACVPDAFEPMVPPHDFAWSSIQLDVAARIEGNRLADENTIPLMNGGISESHAIELLILVDRSLSRKRPVEASGAAHGPGTIWCSDTVQRQMPFYLAKHSGASRGLKRLGALASASAIAAIALVLLTVGCQPTRAGLLAAPAATFAVGPLVVTLPFLAVARSKLTFQHIKHVRVLLSIRIATLCRLVFSSVDSVLALASSVLMFRVRALQYQAAARELKGRFIATHVHGLHRRRPTTLPDAIRACAARASRVPTTLWLSDSQCQDLITTATRPPLWSFNATSVAGKMVVPRFDRDFEFRLISLPPLTTNCSPAASSPPAPDQPDARGE